MPNAWEAIFFPLLGTIIIPFIVPSIVLFLILESTCVSRFPKYIGFFLPAFVIVGGCLYEIWSLHLQTVAEGISDGSSEMFVYFVECYGIALFLPLFFYCWAGKNVVEPGKKDN